MSRSPPRTKATTRKRKRPSPLAPLLAFAVLLAACVTTTEPPPQRGDVSNAPELARDAAAILLELSAYDYALVGTLNGESARVVAPERYATVAREITRDAVAFTSASIAASANAQGPVRDRVVGLGDALTELGRDAGAFDGTDRAVLARILADVDLGWRRVSELATALPPDPDLQAAIARGTSFAVTARAERVYALTVGPFSTAAEAEEAARKIGEVESVTASPPLVVRVGTYADRVAADRAASGIAVKGFLTSSIAEEQLQLFTRGDTAPDVELWKEPLRVFDTHGGARRVAISPDGSWLATGSDDGTVAIFSGAGVLRALPTFNAGVAHVLFSDDGRWLFAGGLTLATIGVPDGVSYGSQIRLPSPATQVLFVPTARAFAATSRGPTGVAGEGGGEVDARAPDGAILGQPFPLLTPAAGAVLAASGTGELYIGTPAADGRSTDIEALRLGAERSPRGVVQVPGTVRLLAIDPAGVRAAAVTEKDLYRFGPKDVDPTGTLRVLAPAPRALAFGADGTLFVMEAARLIAFGPDGRERWTVPLTDGRRLLVGRRVVVLDGAERLIVVDQAGRVDELGSTGILQDVSMSPDGQRVAALTEGRRAVLFSLP